MAGNLRKIVGGVVRRERVKRGMTQIELARKAKLTDVYISRVENGAMNSTLDSLEQISSAFGIAPSEFLKDMPSLRAEGIDRKAAASIKHAIKILESYLSGLKME